MKKLSLMLLCILYLLSIVCAQADINLPASLSVIGEEAFAGDSSISGLVEVSENVYRIQAGAFSDTNLTGLELYDSVTFIEDNIVAGSPVIYVVVLNPNAELSENALNGTEIIVSQHGDSAYHWAEEHGVEWYDCNDLVPHGDFIYYISEGTAKLLFANNTDAVHSSAKVPVAVNGNFVTEISEHAFSYCYGLQSVSIPDTISLIPDGNNWPRDLDISTYSTGVEPVRPSEESIDIDMPDSTLVLTTGITHWIDLPEGCPEGRHMWYSSDDSIVSVNQNGEITCNALGNAAISLVIRCEDAIYTGVVQVHVVEPRIELRLNPNSTTNPVVGQMVPVNLLLHSNLSYSDFLKSSATFSSDNEEVFTCTEGSRGSCFITGVAPGKANLIVEISYGEFYASAEFPITVRESELGLNYTTLYTYSGLFEQLVLLGDLPEDASIAWYSDNPEFAFVDETGLIELYDIEGDDIQAETTVYCEVTYADGNTERYDCRVCVLERNAYVGIDENPDHFCFYEGEIGSTDNLPVYFDWMWWSVHNSIQPEAELEFISDNPDILYFAPDGTYHANQTGEVNVTVRGYADVDGGLENYGEFTAVVYAPRFEFDFDDSPIELPMTCTHYHLLFDIQSDVRILSCQYTSSDPDVVAVSADGYLQPVSEGTAEVTLTIEAVNGYAVSGTVEVTVIADTFTMSPEAMTLNVGESCTLFAVPELSDDLYVVEYQFHSDDSDIVQFDNFVVSGVSAGSSYVSCKVRLNDDRWFEAKTLVTVVDPECPVKLNTNYVSLEYTQSYQLEATFAKEPESVTWTSDDPDRVSVDENGLITLVDTYDHGNIFTVYCTAVIDGVEYTACCSVQCPPLRVAVYDFPYITALNAGEEEQLNFFASVADIDLEIGYIWSTGDDTIATIDGNGLLKALKTGATTYTCTIVDAADNSVITEFVGDVYVNTASEDPTALIFSRPGYLVTLPGGRYDNEYAYVEVESGYGWDSSMLRYTSDDEGIVIVHEDGRLEGVTPGMTNIHVTMAGFPNLKATVPVIVAEDVWLSTGEEPLPISVAEEFVFDLHGMPFDEGDGEYYQFRVNYDPNLVRYVGQNEEGDMVFKAINDEHHGLEGELWVFGEHYDNLGVWLQPYRSEFTLNEDVLYLGVGEEWELYPEFDRNTDFDGWGGTDDNVAIYDYERGVVVAVGPGTCYMGYIGEDWDGNEIVSGCWITVSEDPTWKLVSIDVPSVVHVGQTYDANSYISSPNSYCHPDHCWESSNPEIISYNEDYEVIEVHQPGVVELTCIAEKNGEVQTLTKTIRAVELPLRMSHQYLDLRPGFTKELSVIAGQGKEIENVRWYTSNSSIITVDSEGNVTAIGNEGEASVYAIATFTDGTTATAQVIVHIVRNDEIWLNFFELEQDHHMSVSGETAPDSKIVEAWFSTDADPSELTIEWNINETYDENGDPIEIVRIEPYDVASYDGADDLNDDQFYAPARFTAVAEGDVDINVVIYNHDLGVCKDRWIRVRVDDPFFDISIGENEYFLHTGDCRGLNYWYEERPGYGMIYPYVFTSSDESIVSVAENGWIRAIAPGEATITHSVYCEGRLLDSVEFHVFVEGAVLSDSEITLNKGETHQLIGRVITGLSYDHYSYSSSNPAVAIVTNDGLVKAVGAGSATITYRVRVDDIDTIAMCKVNVNPSEEDVFTLNHTSLTLPGDQYAQLEAISSIGKPSSVEWKLDNYDLAQIDENGLLYAHPFGNNEHRSVVVTCTAVINGEEYTATCDVTLITPKVAIGGFDGYSIVGIGQDQEDYRYIDYNIAYNPEDISLSLRVEDDEIAEAYFCEEDVVAIRGLSSGETTVTLIVETPDGFKYERSINVYVDPDEVELTEFYPTIEKLLLFMPESGRVCERYIPIHSAPEYASYDVHFESDNEDVVLAYDTGWVAAVAPGTANITITLRDHPEIDPIVLPVLVAENADYRIVGLEEGIRTGEMIQLEIESTDNWHEYAHNIRFYTHHGHFSLSDDGLLYAREPDNNVCDFWVNFDLWDEGWEDNHEFNYYCDEEFFYIYHPAEETIVHTNQHFWPDTRQSFDVHGWVVSSDDESIIAVAEDGDHWIGMNPGTTTIHVKAIIDPETGETYPVELSVEATVIEDETPIITNCSAPLMRVGETHLLDFSIEPHLYNGADWYITSSDESIVRSDGYNHDWQDQTVTAMAPGVAYLTVHAKYGELEGTDTIAVYVVDDRPAWVNSEDVELRPGQSKQLEITAAEGKVINSIEWVSSCPDYVSVNENGLITAGDYGNAQIAAIITFEDESVYTTYTKVGIAQDDGLWLNFHGWPGNVELGLNENFGPATSERVEAFFNSNMAEHEPHIEWISHNEDVVIIDGTDCGYTDGGIQNGFVASGNLVATGEGETEVTIVITSEFDHYEERTFWVNVVSPFFEINSDTPELTLNVNGPAVPMDIRFDHNDHIGNFSYYTVTSSNESIVRINQYNWLLGIAPGTATVTVNAYSDGDRLMASRDFPVTVVSPIQLSATEVTLAQGNSENLQIVNPDGVEYHDASWSSDNEDVAIVSGNGIVYANGVGYANACFEYYIDGERFEISCRIFVPYADESFRMSEDVISLVPGETYPLEIISDETPDRVEWDVNNWNSISVDENGNVRADEFILDWVSTVYCTAYFGDETRTAACIVKHANSGVFLDAYGSMHGVNIDEEAHLVIGYRVFGNITSEVHAWVDDPECADIWVDENGRVIVRGKQPGVTIMHVAIVGSDGSRCERTAELYVATPFPDIESINIHENPMIMPAGHNRDIPWSVTPDGVPIELVFSCDDENGILYVSEDGRIEAYNPGRVTVHAEDRNNPDLYTDFDVIVLGDPTFEGLENNAMEASSKAQLHFSFGDYVHQDDLAYRYESNDSEDQFILYDDGTIEAYEPGEYCIWVYIDCGDHEASYNYWFNVEWPEEHFYLRRIEFAMYAGDVNWVEHNQDIGLDYLSCEFEHEGIVEYVPEEEALRAIAPGETDVYLYGHYWDSEERVECANVMHVTVYEAEPLNFEASVASVLHVGDRYDVTIGIEDCKSTYYPIYICTSSDDAILRVEDGFGIVGVAPGEVTVTVQLGHGDTATYREFNVTVVE